MAKNLKIALVNPRVESYSGTMPPLGLLCIAGILERSGLNVKIFDLYPYDDRDFPSLIDFSPDIVGMTVLTDYWPRAVHTASVVSKLLPDATLVIGGVHVTVLPKDSLEQLEADIAVLGEGEYTMLELCQQLAAGRDWRDIHGIFYRDVKGVFITTPARPFIDNLDALPFPARHMLDFDEYLVPPGMIRGYWFDRATTVMTSRGCPFTCIWCGSQCTFGRKVRNRSINNVIVELKLLIENYAVDAVWFVDDTFTLNKQRVYEFCEKLTAQKIGIKWGCQAHVKTADEQMFRAMKKAGLVQLDFGVESGSDLVLKNLRKDSNADLITKAFGCAKRAGVRMCATFMFGSPGETEQEVMKTFAVAKRIKPDFVSSFFITPYPATELMDLAVKNRWTIAADKTGSGLKKKPALLINFSEQQLFRIRERFQKMFFFSNFIGAFLSPSFFFKALGLVFQYPGGITASFRVFRKTLVFDDFVFNFINYYIMHRNKKKHKVER